MVSNNTQATLNCTGSAGLMMKAEHSTQIKRSQKGEIVNFKTAWDRGETTITPAGDPIAPVYDYRIDKKTGRKILEKVGETNLYEKIQASLESSKLENIIKRATQGDLSVLEQMNGQYIDISELPTNLIDMQNMIYKAKGEFEKLDAETRSKFENSVEKYISLYGSEEWADNMGLRKETETPKEETKKEVKEEKKDE